MVIMRNMRKYIHHGSCFTDSCVKLMIHIDKSYRSHLPSQDMDIFIIISDEYDILILAGEFYIYPLTEGGHKGLIHE